MMLWKRHVDLIANLSLDLFDSGHHDKYISTV